MNKNAKRILTWTQSLKINNALVINNFADGDTDFFADDSTCFKLCDDYADAFLIGNLI